MPADVGQHGQGPGGDHGAADRQAVEAVGEVHGVARSHDHDHHENQERQEGQRPKSGVQQAANHQVRTEVLEERHDQARGVQPVVLQGDQGEADRQSRQELVEQLGASGQSEVAAVDHLQIVVGEPDAAVGQRRHHRDPDEAIAQVGPQQRRHHHGDHDQHSAHGRSACLALMGLGAVFANVLADLEVAQSPHHRRADHQSHEQRRQAGECGAKRQIAEDSERADVKNDKTLLIEQPIEQIIPRR